MHYGQSILHLPNSLVFLPAFTCWLTTQYPFSRYPFLAYTHLGSLVPIWNNTKALHKIPGLNSFWMQ